MSRKLRELETLISERGTEAEILRNQVTELKIELEGYRNKESAIAQTLMEAQTMRSSMVAEAQKKAEMILAEAEEIRTRAVETADNLLSEAHSTKERLVLEAQNDADAILAEAKKTAQRVRSDAEFEAASRIDAMNEQIAKQEGYCDYLNELVSVTAEHLNNFLGNVKADYSAKKAENAAYAQPVAGDIKLPDDYKNCTELYHSILKLDGRDIPVEKSAIEKYSESKFETPKLEGCDEEFDIDSVPTDVSFETLVISDNIGTPGKGEPEFSDIDAAIDGINSLEFVDDGKKTDETAVDKGIKI